MTEVSGFLAGLEADVASARRASEHSCQALAALAEPERAALQQSMVFLGCPDGVLPDPVAEAQLDRAIRVQVARILLLRFYADTDDPRWSSKVLEDLSDAVVGLPGGSMGDLIEGLVQLWDREKVPLTEVVGNLARDVGLLCFRRHRASYAQSDFSWLVNRLEREPTSAIAYLALRTLPPDDADRVQQAILDSLAGTAYESEARSSLEDD